MSVESSEYEDSSVSRTRGESYATAENSEAVDILAIWVLEDICAVAKSFQLDPMNLLQFVLDRVQSEALFFKRQSGKAGR